MSAFLLNQLRQATKWLGLLCLVALLALVTSKAPATTSKKPNLIIFTDIATGLPPSRHTTYADIDDALAIIDLIASKRFHILAISCQFGNSRADLSEQVAHRLMTLLKQPIPIVKGSNHPWNTPILENALSNKIRLSSRSSRYLAHLLTQQSATLLVLGPATDVARLIQQFPDVIPHIHAILLEMGQWKNQPLHLPHQAQALTDYNYVSDPLAIQFLLKHRLPLKFISLQAIKEVNLSHADFAKAVKPNSDLGQWFLSSLHHWGRRWKTLSKQSKIYPWDASFSYFLVNPSAFHCQRQKHPKLEAHALAFQNPQQNQGPLIFCDHLSEPKRATQWILKNLHD